MKQFVKKLIKSLVLWSCPELKETKQWTVFLKDKRGPLTFIFKEYPPNGICLPVISAKLFNINEMPEDTTYEKYRLEDFDLKKKVALYSKISQLGLEDV